MRLAAGTLLFCFLTSTLLADDDTHSLAAVKELPKAAPKALTSLLAAEGYQVKGESGAVCNIWLQKTLAAKKGFSPTFNVNYPFTNGQLVGLLEVAEKAEFTDFRGQEIKPGLYTLRYGQQPQDGNHIGTSELSDFLLGIPLKDDTDPTATLDLQTLFKRSAKTVGSNHPAIFSLLPSEKAPAKTTLDYDEDTEFWILNAATQEKPEGGDAKKAGLRLVVVGKSEE